MTQSRETFKPQEFCSRKLWDLVSASDSEPHINTTELNEAIAELAIRRHYLAELREIGRLGK